MTEPTDGRHFDATASAKDASSLTASMDVEVAAPSVGRLPKLPVAMAMPNAKAHASSAPKKPSTNVLPPVLFLDCAAATCALPGWFGSGAVWALCCAVVPVCTGSPGTACAPAAGAA